MLIQPEVRHHRTAGDPVRLAEVTNCVVRCPLPYPHPGTQIIDETFNIPVPIRSVPTSVTSLGLGGSAPRAIPSESKVGLSPFWKSDVPEETAEVENDCSFEEGGWDIDAVDNSDSESDDGDFIAHDNDGSATAFDYTTVTRDSRGRGSNSSRSASISSGS